MSDQGVVTQISTLKAELRACRAQRERLKEALRYADTEIQRRLNGDKRMDDYRTARGEPGIPFDEDLGEALNVVQRALAEGGREG